VKEKAREYSTHPRTPLGSLPVFCSFGDSPTVCLSACAGTDRAVQRAEPRLPKRNLKRSEAQPNRQLATAAAAAMAAR